MTTTITRAIATCFMLLALVASARAAPRGELLELTLESSTHFPGPPHRYRVYVPAQYRPDVPAALFLALEVQPSEATAAMDDLIARKQMPVAIGLFLTADADRRSLMLDSPGDAFVRFLMEELLPDLEKRQSGDGRPIRLSPRGNDRAIGGIDSGAVAAFTAGWERPADFPRVWASTGPFTAVRGADRYPSLLRRFEPRPFRLFLGAGREQVGDGDVWGDRLPANQALHRALVYAGHDVQAVLGAPDAGQRSIMTKALRWLWRRWPAPIVAGRSRNPVLEDILIPGPEGDWQLVGEGYKFVEGPTANARGELFFNDIPAAKTYKVGLDGQVAVHIADSQKANGQAFGPDGRLYAITGGPGKVMAYDPQGGATVFAQGFSGNDLVVAHNGNLYVTSPPDGRNPTRPSEVVLVRPDGKHQVVDSGLRYANGVTLSRDQKVLFVDDHRSRWVYRYEILPDGTLAHKRRFCALVVPETADDTSADGMKVDRQGRLFVATRTGLLQVCDREGRVVAIIPTPNRRISNVAFGGPKFDILYVTAGDRVWRRRLGTQGANAWAPPLPAP